MTVACFQVVNFRYFWKNKNPDHFPPDYQNRGLGLMVPAKAAAVEGGGKAGDTDWFCPKCRRRGFETNQDVFDHMNPGIPTFDCPGIMDAVSVRLDNGVFGKIVLENLSDRRVVFPQERVKVSTLYCARSSA